MDAYNTILNGDALSKLKELPDESVNCVVTSPPYFQLRDYGTEPISWEDGLKCELGQEPTLEQYIHHLILIFNEVHRVLRNDGSIWVVIGDTYGTKSGGMEDLVRHGEDTKMYGKLQYNFAGVSQKNKPKNMDKSLLMIPSRFAIAMTDAGWILRSDIIWKKNNCMPSSIKDRYTVDYEHVYFFVKSDEPQFWSNEKTNIVKYKKPAGINGVENIDWYWKQSYEKKFSELSPSTQALVMTKSNTKIEDDIVYHKKSYWSSHDYFFKPQYEPYETGINTSDKPRKAGVERVRDENYLSKYVTTEYRGKGKKDYDKKNVQNPSDVKRRILESMKTKIKFGGNKVAGGQNPTYSGNEWIVSPKGRIARAVWNINTQPSPLKHYAIFPEKLVAKCLDPACPERICNNCGNPYLTIFDESYIATRPGLNTLTTDKSGSENDPNKELHKSHWSKYKPIVVRDNFKLVKSCECETNEYHAGVVLDIFGGTGTTALVAKKMNMNYILIEPNPEYCKFIEERLAKPIPIVQKPEIKIGEPKVVMKEYMNTLTNYM